MSALVIIGGLGAMVSLTAGLLKLRAEKKASQTEDPTSLATSQPVRVTIRRGGQTIYTGDIGKGSLSVIQSLVESEKAVSASASR